MTRPCQGRYPGSNPGRRIFLPVRCAAGSKVYIREKPPCWQVGCAAGVAQMKVGKKRFLNKVLQDGTMREKEMKSAVAGVSHLTRDQLKKFEGKCVAIVDGKAVFAHENAAKVLEELKKFESSDKVFTSVPRGNITLVK